MPFSIAHFCFDGQLRYQILHIDQQKFIVEIYHTISDGSTLNCITPSCIILIAEWCSGYGLSFVIWTTQIQLRVTTHAADSSYLSIHRPSCYTRASYRCDFLFLIVKSFLFAHSGVVIP